MTPEDAVGIRRLLVDALMGIDRQLAETRSGVGTFDWHVLVPFLQELEAQPEIARSRAMSRPFAELIRAIAELPAPPERPEP